MNVRTLAVSHLSTTALAMALAVVPATAQSADTPTPVVPPPLSIAVVQSAYGHLPLSFEANEGQADASVQFLAHGGGHELFLTPNEAVLALTTSQAKAEGRKGDAVRGGPSVSAAPPSHSVVRMKIEGANPNAKVVGLDKLPGIVNYFIGADSSKWRTNVPTYQKVEYQQVYPGVDLVYYGYEGQLEYDLIVAPGADPQQIALSFEGAEQIAVDAHGDLVLTAPRSSTDAAAANAAAPTLRLHKPVVYQVGDHGEKHLLTGTYVLVASDTSSSRPPSAALRLSETPDAAPPIPRVAFQVASYDWSKPLVIDPVLSWATYLGGGEDDRSGAIAVDSAGNVYVTGTTGTPGSEFPGVADSPIQSTYAGGQSDVFVTKLNAAGTAIVYSTYLGGSGIDQGLGIAVDAAGNAYVTGVAGTDFPGTAGSLIQSTRQSGAFVTKLNAAGTAIVYSTYLGADEGWAIAVDQAGNAYMTGDTGTGLPGATSSLIQNTSGGATDAFVMKINAAGTAIVYSTYLGGSGYEIGLGIAVDRAGNAYVTGGTTTTSGFPGTAGSLIQKTSGGQTDAFITKLNTGGTALVYSTYLGGASGENANSIAVDKAGNAYVTGVTETLGSGFPGTANSLIQSTHAGGGADAFVTKLNAAGTALVFSTYLGGSGYDEGYGIGVDQAGNAYVAGLTNTHGFPGTAGSLIQSTLGSDGIDAFVTKLNSTGTTLVYSTYLGGSSGYDFGGAIAVDQADNAYVTGVTATPGSDFPGVADSPIQSMYGGGVNGDVFVAKIASNVPFAAFRAKAEIDLHHVASHDAGNAPHNDQFDMVADFTLSRDGNGILPLRESVRILLGTFSVTIPAGSFKPTNNPKKQVFAFKGFIDGVKLDAVLRPLTPGQKYELAVDGKGVDLTGTTNPVTVGVTIGDDSGNEQITADFGHMPKEKH